MREILELEQRSTLWHQYRSKSIGSSEVSALLGTNPWKTAYTLWEEKTGRRSGQFTNAAMQRGIDFEDEARACLEAQLGLTFTPKVFRRTDKTFLMASLDGITEDGSILCEIKCPSTNGLRGVRPKRGSASLLLFPNGLSDVS